MKPPGATRSLHPALMTDVLGVYQLYLVNLAIAHSPQLMPGFLGWSSYELASTYSATPQPQSLLER